MNLSELKRIAEAASPGPWEWRDKYRDDWIKDFGEEPEYHQLQIRELMSVDGGVVLDDGSAGGEYSTRIDHYSENGIYLATFNPQRVLKMIELLAMANDYCCYPDWLESFQKEFGGA